MDRKCKELTEQYFNDPESKYPVPAWDQKYNMSKQIIEQMGGRIDVMEDGGPSRLQGTTVRVNLFRDPEV
jgi:hypothetical protein